MTTGLRSQCVKLEHPVRICDQVWPDDAAPLVSILCITFNHGKYIDECIRGLLAQETTFPVEIIVHDDRSSDSTRTVIDTYCDRHPHLFKRIYQKENQYSRGKSPTRLAFTHARGEFIAICEGDDYWTLPSKLQRQIEVFDQKPACILVGGRVAITRDGMETPYMIEPPHPPEVLATLGPTEMLRGDWGMHTLSRVVRRDIWSGYVDRVLGSRMSSDFLFMLYCISASHSRPEAFQCIDEVVGVYRENMGGIWFSKPANQKVLANIETLRFALDNFDLGKDVNILEWVLLRYIRETAKGVSGWLAYAKNWIIFFSRRNLRRIRTPFGSRTRSVC